MAFVTPDDVTQLQTQVRSQRDAIQFAIGACPAAKADPVLMAQWDAEDVIVNGFLDESPSWLSTATQMDVGQQIQRDLGQWGPRIAAKGCSNVPPAPVGPPPSALQQATSLVEEVAIAAVVLGLVFIGVKYAKRGRS